MEWKEIVNIFCYTETLDGENGYASSIRVTRDNQGRMDAEETCVHSGVEDKYFADLYAIYMALNYASRIKLRMELPIEVHIFSANINIVHNLVYWSPIKNSYYDQDYAERHNSIEFKYDSMYRFINTIRSDVLDYNTAVAFYALPVAKTIDFNVTMYYHVFAIYNNDVDFSKLYISDNTMLWFNWANFKTNLDITIARRMEANDFSQGDRREELFGIHPSNVYGVPTRRLYISTVKPIFPVQTKFTTLQPQSFIDDKLKNTYYD